MIYLLGSTSSFNLTALLVQHLRGGFPLSRIPELHHTIICPAAPSAPRRRRRRVFLLVFASYRGSRASASQSPVILVSDLRTRTARATTESASHLVYLLTPCTGAVVSLVPLHYLCQAAESDRGITTLSDRSKRTGRRPDVRVRRQGLPLYVACASASTSLSWSQSGKRNFPPTIAIPRGVGQQRWWSFGKRRQRRRRPRKVLGRFIRGTWPHTAPIVSTAHPLSRSSRARASRDISRRRATFADIIIFLGLGPATSPRLRPGGETPQAPRSRGQDD
ncbi:hypothetical protein B0H12DRAFT_1118069 [Mycena haematopus]|nr:hypothetical protein B0H12DRAFT_1118069 [Mycena haematopus]